MAQYKVKDGDTLPKIAAKFQTTVNSIKTKNKIYSVSRGQEIDVPPPPKPPQLGFNLPGFGFNIPTQIPTPFGTFQTPGASVNIPSTSISVPIPQQAMNAANAFNRAGQVASGLMTMPGQLPGMALNAAGQMLQGAGFGFTPNIDPRAGQRQVTNQLGSMVNAQQALLNQYAGRTSAYTPTAQQGLTPSQAQNIPSAYSGQQVFSQPVMPQRPTGTYTGNPQNNANDAAWVSYWNYQAANPSTPSAPSVMTKSQIWEMKKRARVEKQAQQQAEQGYQPNPYTPFFTGNAVSNLALRAK
jgi:hypothetical protein